MNRIYRIKQQTTFSFGSESSILISLSILLILSKIRAADYRRFEPKLFLDRMNRTYRMNHAAINQHISGELADYRSFEPKLFLDRMNRICRIKQMWIGGREERETAANQFPTLVGYLSQRLDYGAMLPRVVALRESRSTLG